MIRNQIHKIVDSLPEEELESLRGNMNLSSTSKAEKLLNPRFSAFIMYIFYTLFSVTPCHRRAHKVFSSLGT